MRTTPLFAALLLAASPAAQAEDSGGTFSEVECWVNQRQLPRESLCGVLDVPENHAEPDARRLSIPVIRLGPDDSRHMAIVLGGGGPGARVGIASLAELGYWEQFRIEVLGADRGLILMEQRGAVETPRLKCREMRNEIPWLLSHDLSVAEEMDFQKISAGACLSRLQDSGIGLEHYTTMSSAHDFEILRRELGIAQLDLIGISYGARIAFDLTRSYPASVRQILLDSPTIPQASSLSPIIHFDRLFGQIAEKCLGLNACSRTYGDMRSNIRAAASRLDANPAKVAYRAAGTDAGEMVLNRHRLMASVLLAFYSQGLVSNLPRYLRDLAITGQSKLSSEYASNLAWFYRLDMIEEALYYSITCREMVPFISDEIPPLETAWGAETASRHMKDFCTGTWNVGNPIKPEEIASNGHPMLVLSGTLDPITPDSIVDSTIGGMPGVQHFRLNSTHSTLSNNSCARTVAALFMENPQRRASHPCLERQASNFQ